MIVVRVLLSVKSEDRETFLATMRGDVEASRQADGCVRFDLFQSVEGPDAFVLLQEWKDRRSFDDYRNSPGFAERGKSIFPLLAGKPDAAYYAAETIQ